MVDHRAIVLVLVAIVFFGLGDFVAKLLADSVSGSLKEIIANRTTLLYFVLLGVFLVGGFLSWVAALKFGDVSKIVPIQKLSLVLTVALGVIILKEAFTIKTVVGTILAVAAILLLI